MGFFRFQDGQPAKIPKFLLSVQGRCAISTAAITSSRLAVVCQNHYRNSQSRKRKSLVMSCRLVVKRE